jgi:transposase
MVLRLEDLPRDPGVLAAMVLAQAVEIEKLQAALKAVNALVFGPRSERRGVILDDQMALDLGDLGPDGTPPAANDDEPPAALVRAARKKAKRNVGALPKHLARVEQVIEPETRDCPCCAGTLHKIGEDVCETLDHVPAILRVLRIIRPKYGCRACEGAIVQAPAAPRPIEGGMATTALIAHVVTSKFAWFVPLYRQVQIMAGQGIALDRSTLALWVKRAAWWLSGLYDLQLEAIHSYPRVFCDETRMPVLEPGRGKVKICQFWAHSVDDRPWNGPAAPAVAYVFARGRGHREIKEQLARYQGILQVDGYGAYKALAKADRRPGSIQLAFCLAHARRKFVEVYKSSGSPIARAAIERIAEVYAVEARIRGTSAGHRLSTRQAETAPMMEALKTLLTQALTEISTISPLAGAARYALGHWAGLTRFLDDGRIEVDTNTVERSMRPIALGRKNSLFSGSDGGAESWAILASLLNTAKLNGVDPYTWLVDALESVVSGRVKNHQLGQLLAWNWKAERAASATPGAEKAAA